MTIYVDADACPVREEIINTALRHQHRVIMVCNGGIRPHPHPLIELHIVPSGPDEADKWIAEDISPGDILVTGDIPLAAKAVAKSAIVLQGDGSILDQDNIGNVLASRDLMADIRAENPFHIEKSTPKMGAGKGRFTHQLDQLLSKATREYKSP